MVRQVDLCVNLVGMNAEPLTVSWQVLRAAAQLVEAVQAAVEAKGFDGVRPVHGYAFVRISHGGATVVDVAEHLGVTKQSASQLVDQLVQRGYITREPHPDDARARLLALTARGVACTRAADRAAAALMVSWREQMGARDFQALHRALAAVVLPGPVRPPW
jgi:DNA-binding MarR family transcriptional regulator